jgi:hypothetical protein
MAMIFSGAHLLDVNHGHMSLATALITVGIFVGFGGLIMHMTYHEEKGRR